MYKKLRKVSLKNTVLHQKVSKKIFPYFIMRISFAQNQPLKIAPVKPPPGLVHADAK